MLSVSLQRKYNFYHQNTLLDAFRTNSRNIIGRKPPMVIPLLANQDLMPMLAPGHFSTLSLLNHCTSGPSSLSSSEAKFKNFGPLDWNLFLKVLFLFKTLLVMRQFVCRCFHLRQLMQQRRSFSFRLTETKLRNQFLLLSMRINDNTNASIVCRKMFCDVLRGVPSKHFSEISPPQVHFR